MQVRRGRAKEPASEDRGRRARGPSRPGWLFFVSACLVVICLGCEDAEVSCAELDSKCAFRGASAICWSVSVGRPVVSEVACRPFASVCVRDGKVFAVSTEADVSYVGVALDVGALPGVGTTAEVSNGEEVWVTVGVAEAGAVRTHSGVLVLDGRSVGDRLGIAGRLSGVILGDGVVVSEMDLWLVVPEGGQCIFK